MVLMVCLWVPEEANDRQRVADILSVQGLAESVARSLKRLRWREEIRGLILHADENGASCGGWALPPIRG